MGSSAWSDDTYKHIKHDYSTKAKAEIFTSDKLDKDMNPYGVKFRESRDSEAHPNSVAIMANLDETGSMGDIPEYLIKNKLGALMNTLINHGIPDAHVMFAGVGDHLSDRAPFQAGQFEAGTKELDLWLTKIYLEGNGGGHGMESYSLAWYFAARHTSIDCFEKREEKGFLFTIGDEWVHPVLEAAKIEAIFGDKIGQDISMESILQEVQRMYHVIHLHVVHDSMSDQVSAKWKKLLGQNLIMVEDYNNIAEIIASTVAVIRGSDLEHVVKGFDASTAKSVSNALVKISSAVSTTKSGVVNL